MVSLPQHVADDFPLSQANDQRTLVVSRIALCDEEELRLRVMGICVGRPLQMVRRGEPLIVNVSGTHIVMSRVLADSIFVQPAQPALGAARAVS